MKGIPFSLVEDKKGNLKFKGKKVKKCKYGKTQYDIDCYNCVEFIEGRCGG